MGGSVGGLSALLRASRVFFRSYIEWLLTHARLVAIGIIVLTAFWASQLPALRVEIDPDANLPQGHPYIRALRSLETKFGEKNLLVIGLFPADGRVFTPRFLTKLQRITNRVRDLPGVVHSSYLAIASPIAKSIEGQGDTLLVRPLLDHAPTSDADAEEARRRTYLNPFYRGIIVSSDGTATAIIVNFRLTREMPGYPEIQSRVAHLLAEENDGTFTVHFGGPIAILAAMAKVTERTVYLFPLAMLIIAAIHYEAFRTIQGMILPLVTALLAVIWALGFMGYAGIPMNAWTASVPLMVVTVAAGHSAQMLKRYYEEYARLRDRGAAVVESTRCIGVVMMAAGVTAGSGFAALALLGIPTLAQFGLGVACGIFAAVILEMSFMLALRVVWPTGTATHGEGPLSEWLGYLIRPLAAAVAATPGRAALGFLVIAAAAILGYPWLTTDIDGKTYWSGRTEIGRDLRVFERHFPSTTTLTILLEGPPGSMQTPEAITVMTGLQKAMAEDPDVGRTSSVADVVRRTYEVFAPEDAANGLPLDRELIAQLFLLANSPTFERYVDRSYSRAVVLGFLDRDDSALTRRVMTRLQDHVHRNPSPNIRVLLAGGVGPTVLALNEHTVKGKILNIGVVFAAIFAIASVLLRTPIGGAYVTAPLAMALIVNLGLFSWSRVAFDLTGASIAAIGVSIGADYAIYALYRLREEYQRSGSIDQAFQVMMDTTGRAVLFVALAISAGFSVYLISDFYAFHVLGVFVPLTMLTSSLTALTLLPALVLLLRPRFIVGPPNAARAPAATAPAQAA